MRTCLPVFWEVGAFGVSRPTDNANLKEHSAWVRILGSQYSSFFLKKKCFLLICCTFYFACCFREILGGGCWRLLSQIDYIEYILLYLESFQGQCAIVFHNTFIFSALGYEREKKSLNLIESFCKNNSFNFEYLK